jgi:hypothetical protein
MHIHNWAQWSLLGLSLIALLVSANEHDRAVKRENFWVTSISVGITLALIYFAGGFR